MLSGRRLDILNPSPLDVEIEDIAHGLARVARWNGQTRGGVIFSVAQHSVLVAEIFGRLDPAAPARWRLHALLHDAPEYVIGDMISPFKSALGAVYAEVEERLTRAVLQRFSLNPDPPAALTRLTKKADHISAFYEATLYAGFETDEARQFFGDPEIDPRFLEDLLVPMDPEVAQALFLERFKVLEKAL
jgi:5'-deoxynucleotidase YfbR-like HD superfamily hydrolase